MTLTALFAITLLALPVALLLLPFAEALTDLIVDLWEEL